MKKYSRYLKVIRLFNCNVFLCIFFLLGCSSNIQLKLEHIKNIPLNLNKATAEEIGIGSKSSLVCLETRDDVFVGCITKLYVTDSFLIILDKPAKSVMLFNTEGRFVRKIGQAGSEKGQFTEITDMVYYPETNLVEIFSLPERKLLRFNTSGKFISEIRSEFYFLAFYHSKNGYWVYGCFPENKKKGVFEFRGNKYNLLLLSDDLKTAKGGFCESRNFFDRTSSNDNFQLNDEGELFFHYGYDNIVYKLKDNDAIPYWFLDFGKKRLPYDFIVTLTTRKQFDQAVSLGAVKYDGFIYNLRIGSSRISLGSSEFGSFNNASCSIVNINDPMKVTNYTRIKSAAQSGLLLNPIHFSHNKVFFVINPRMMNKQELSTLMRKYHVKTNDASNLILLIVDENDVA